MVWVHSVTWFCKISLFEFVCSSASVISNGMTNIASGSTTVAHVSNTSAGIGPELGLTSVGTTLQPFDETKKLTSSSANEDSHKQPSQSSSDRSVVPAATSTSTVCFSSSDPVLVLSNDSRVPAAVGTIKREVGGHRPSGEPNAVIQVENKLTAGPDFENFRTLFFGLFL